MWRADMWTVLTATPAWGKGLALPLCHSLQHDTCACVGRSHSRCGCKRRNGWQGRRRRASGRASRPCRPTSRPCLTAPTADSCATAHASALTRPSRWGQGLLGLINIAMLCREVSASCHAGAALCCGCLPVLGVSLLRFVQPFRAQCSCLWMFSMCGGGNDDQH